MKTWICDIYGGGTPTYIVSAENEKRAWALIKKEFKERFPHCYLCEERPSTFTISIPLECSGLIEFPNWKAETECIIDIHEVYAPNSTSKKGSFKDF